ncbi:MAG TPA: TonB-dependent receptor [Myxococcaceae bacterium]|nr:TonB-dependent receptor [Myxococcaceae bacterium]
MTTGEGAPAAPPPSEATPGAAGEGAPADGVEASPAPAVEDPVVEERKSAQTVVTATRTPTPVSELPRAVTLITREELARRPGRTTPEALLEQEGVFLQKTNQGGGAPIIRGLYGQQVLLLVDGVRMNNATVRAGPNQFLNTVDAFTVEQIEVLRGPGSVLYGSDALGGVVNVRTFWPRYAREVTPIGELRAQAGSADLSLQGHARAGVSLQNTAVAAAFTARDFNDLRGGALVGLQQYTGYEEGDATFKLRHRVAPGAQLYLQYQAVRQTNAPRLDRSMPGDFRRFAQQFRDFIHAGWEQTLSGPIRRLEIDLSAQRQGDVTERFRVGRDRVERDNVDEWTYGLRAEAEAQPSLGFLGSPVAVFGAEAYYDRTTSRFERGSISNPSAAFSLRPEDARYAGTPVMTSGGIFGLLSSDAREPFSWHAGARVQANQTYLPEDPRLNLLFPTAANPPPIFPETTVTALGLAGELGVQQRVAPGTTLLVNLASGFRAPNVDDYMRMGAEGPGFLVPNRSLSSEQSLTAEVGARTAQTHFSAHVFYAYTIIPGLVGNVPYSIDGQTRTPDNIPYLVRQNRDRADIHSLEAAVSVRPIPQLVLASHATWTHTRQRRRDLLAPGEAFITEPLSRTPPLNGVVRATYEPTESTFVEGAMRWAARADQISAADRLDIRICAEAPRCTGTPGFVMVNARGGVRLGKRLSVALTLQNLFDASFRTHGSGVDEAGRSAVLSLEASL